MFCYVATYMHDGQPYNVIYMQDSHPVCRQTVMNSKVVVHQQKLTSSMQATLN